MNRGRVFAHIYEINSLEVKAYLLPGTDSLIQGHSLGVSKIARIGSFVVINSGGNRLIGIINSLHVTEPEKLYWLKTNYDLKDKQIIRTVSITLIGQFFYDENKETYFERGIVFYPSIDEEVLVPNQDELDLILNEKIKNKNKLIEIGTAYAANDVKVKIDPVKLLSRHCAIVGSTGNGKSCTVSVLINELRRNNIKLPIFIFDINGEYSWAFKDEQNIRILKFGGKLESDFPKENKFIHEELRINFATFRRRTWRNILKPSERAQIPALNFAIDILEYLSVSYSEITFQRGLSCRVPTFITSNPNKKLSEFLCGDPAETDQNKLRAAYDTIQFLIFLSTNHSKVTLAPTSTKKVGMEYLSKAITDRWSIQPGRNGLAMDAFRYGNISHLCDRINELARDKFFKIFCDVDGNSGFSLDETTKSEIMVSGQKTKIALTIFDLSAIPQEYLPIFVDSLLEQSLLEALENKFKEEPHLLVLDEAHHYLGQRSEVDSESFYLGNSPGDRIAKEGRKYGLHLVVSTQRPGELSETLVAQIGTMISHSLTNESDRQIVSAFGNYSDRTILSELSILPRREAIIIGEAISMPTRIKVSFLPVEKRPKSKDPLEDKI